MFFLIAKTLGVMAQAPQIFIEALLVGLALMWTRWRNAGRIVATLAGVTLAIFSLTPAANIFARPLEDRFPRPTIAEAPTGIVVLGGSMDEALTERRGTPALNEAAERLTEGAALALRFPKARLVFSGGSGRLRPKDTTEADVAREVWRSLGVPAEQMSFENRSRDTWENAAFTKELLKPKPGERWLLVTSAMHMPRAVGIFRKVGFPVIPDPVDYQTGGGPGDFFGLRKPARALYVLETASHEWIGLFAYYLTGKSSALLPAP